MFAIRRTALALTLLALASAAYASPFAYVPGSNDGNVTVIDTATDAVVDTIDLSATFLQGAVVSPDGNKVYVTSISTPQVYVIDAVTNTLDTPIPITSFFNGIAPALNATGTRLYVTGQGVNVIDTATGTEITNILDPDFDNPTGLAVTPDGSKVYVGNAFGGKIVVIDTATNTKLTSINSTGLTRGVEVLPDGSKVYVTDAGDLNVISTATDTSLGTIPILAGAIAVVAHPDGSKVYAATTTGVTVVDTATDTVITSITFGGSHFGIAITPDGSKLYVPDQSSDEVFVVDTATNTSLGPIPVADEPFARGKFVGPEIVCGNGVQQAGEECDDGDVDPGDGCDASCNREPCVSPVPCATPASSSISVKDSTPDSKDGVTWKWKKGSFMSSDLGDPLTVSGYELCIIDDGANALVLPIPAGLTCDGGNDCWKMLGQLPDPKGYKYTNKGTSPEGVSGLTLKAGTGKASIGFKAKSLNLTLPGPAIPATQYFNQTSNVTVRLLRVDGTQCWEAVFPTSSKNTAEQFSAKTP